MEDRTLDSGLRAMRSRGLLNRSRSLAITIVLFSLAVAFSVNAQENQDTTSDADTTGNEESSTSQETAEQDAEELSSENAETDSAESNTMEESTSEEEVEASEPDEVPDFFDPSEEISEDFGVDFPVDI